MPKIRGRVPDLGADRIRPRLQSGQLRPPAANYGSCRINWHSECLHARRGIAYVDQNIIYAAAGGPASDRQTGAAGTTAPALELHALHDGAIRRRPPMRDGMYHGTMWLGHARDGSACNMNVVHKGVRIGGCGVLVQRPQKAQCRIYSPRVHICHQHSRTARRLLPSG